MAKFEIDFLTDFSKEALIAELQRLARSLGQHSLSRRDIDKHGKMSSNVVLKRFGSLRAALTAAGLRPTRFNKASDDDLLDALEALWVQTIEKEGRRPANEDLRAFGVPTSADTFRRRFGSWKNALLAVAERANGDTPIQETPSAAEEPSRERRPLSVRKRFFVLKRDRYRCRLCAATGVPLEVDHIVPFAQGGSDGLDNLQALCVPCNRGKRDSSE